MRTGGLYPSYLGKRIQTTGNHYTDRSVVRLCGEDVLPLSQPTKTLLRDKKLDICSDGGLSASLEAGISSSRNVIKELLANTETGRPDELHNLAWRATNIEPRLVTISLHATYLQPLSLTVPTDTTIHSLCQTWYEKRFINRHTKVFVIYNRQILHYNTTTTIKEAGLKDGDVLHMWVDWHASWNSDWFPTRCSQLTCTG
jgi:hypothetical protein